MISHIRNKRGSTLIPGLIVVTALGIMGTGFISMILTESRNTERSNNKLALTSIAEAGLERGAWEILHGGADYDGMWTFHAAAAPDWTRPALPAPQVSVGVHRFQESLSIGEYRVEVFDFNGTTYIQSSAGVPTWASSSVAAGTRQILQTTITSAPLFSRGMTGLNSINANNGVLVDSYDSTVGPYGGANVAQQGDIATDSIASGAVQIGNNVIVRGDAYVGPGGTPATVIAYSGNGDVTGSELVSSAPTSLPAVTAPTGLPNRGALNVTFGTQTINSSGQYSDINVLVGRIRVTSDATIYVTNNMTVAALSSIQVENNANVNIVVGNNFNVALLAAVNNQSKDPEKFTVYGLNTANQINVVGVCDVHGTFYAPTATMNVGGFVRVAGGAIARNVNIGSLAGFHFDESLKMRAGKLNTGAIQVSSWQTKDQP